MGGVFCFPFNSNDMEIYMSVQNIIATYQMATTEEIKDGVTWYRKAYLDCRKIAFKHVVSTHLVVGVVSALSPNNKWERNIVNADELIGAYINGDGIDSIKVSTYHKMKEKAWHILGQMPRKDDVTFILNGQKITSFYQNIMGYDTCTVDGHARNIYYAERESLTDPKTNIGKKEYAMIQQAYVEAGSLLKVNGQALKAYEVQAITWVTWRRIHGIK